MGQIFVQGIKFSPVIIPPVHRTHGSFMYHWHYIILTNDTIIKWATSRERHQNVHLQFAMYIRLCVINDSFYGGVFSVLYLQHGERHRFQYKLQFPPQKHRCSKKSVLKALNKFSSFSLSDEHRNFFSITFETAIVCMQDWNIVDSLLGLTGLGTYCTLQMMNCCKRILTFLI